MKCLPIEIPSDNKLTNDNQSNGEAMQIKRPRKQSLKNQSGIVMIVTLIALLLLMLSSIALIRSTDTSLLVAGNLAFKRDLINQGEAAIAAFKTNFISGVLSSPTARQSNNSNQGYFATVQATDSNGIPLQLLNSSSFDTSYPSNVITATDGSQIKIRYMIDRMCLTTGAPVASVCTLITTQSQNPSLDTNNVGKNLSTIMPVYRISIRITGPRNTETFMQSSFTANG